MQMVLVAQMLDAGHARRAPFVGNEVHVLGAHPDRHRARRRPGPCQRVAGQQVDRRLAEPLRYVHVRRTLVDLARCAELHQAPTVQDADAARHRHGLDLVVRDVHDRRAEVRLDVLELHTQVGAQLGVQGRKRLVHQIHGGTAHQRPSDRHALHLSTGQPGGGTGELVVDAHQPGDFLHALLDLGLGKPARGRAQRKSEIVEDRQMRVQRVLLEHEGDVARRRGLVRGIAAADMDATGVGPFQSRDQPQQRGLAGSGGPEEHDQLTVADGETHVLQRLDAAEALGYPFDADLRHGSPPTGGAVRRARCAGHCRRRYRTAPGGRPGTSARRRSP